MFHNFNHLLTTRPHDIHEVFISDLHLQEYSPLVEAFLAFLDDLSVLSNLKKLYILGDWFDVWIGDDSYLHLDTISKTEHWITPIISKLKTMRVNGCRTLVLTGNRDFLMRQPFCNIFAGEMLKQPYFIELGEGNNKQTIRLEHGDALCTDDKDYQRFRKYALNPFVQWFLLSKSLKKREKIAEKMRLKSQQANANKSMSIMDVNQLAVQCAFTPTLDKRRVKNYNKKNKRHPNSNIMIHGHTHRPAIHNFDDSNNVRYVLGDWRIHDADSSYEKVTAVIGAIYTDQKIDDLESKSELFDMFEFCWKS